MLSSFAGKEENNAFAVQQNQSQVNTLSRLGNAFKLTFKEQELFLLGIKIDYVESSFQKDQRLQLLNSIYSKAWDIRKNTCFKNIFKSEEFSSFVLALFRTDQAIFSESLKDFLYLDLDLKSSNSQLDKVTNLYMADFSVSLLFSEVLKVLFLAEEDFFINFMKETDYQAICFCLKGTIKLCSGDKKQLEFKPDEIESKTLTLTFQGEQEDNGLYSMFRVFRLSKIISSINSSNLLYGFFYLPPALNNPNPPANKLMFSDDLKLKLAMEVSLFNGAGFRIPYADNDNETDYGAFTLPAEPLKLPSIPFYDLISENELLALVLVSYLYDVKIGQDFYCRIVSILSFIPQL